MFKKAFTLAELSLIFFIMALLAILFYRTLKPDNVVYNNLYYSAYTQMSDVFYEIMSELNTPFTTVKLGAKEYPALLTTADMETFVSKFYDKVNTIERNHSPANDHLADGTIGYSTLDAKYDIPHLFDDNAAAFSSLINNMRISFDVIYCGNDENGNPIPILIATIDINGDNPPNEYNKDIIQFEINKKGILPIGDIESNKDMLSFNLISRYKETQRGINRVVIGDPHIVVNNISYDEAACKGNLPRHTYYEELAVTRCPAGIGVNENCDITDAANITLKCEIEAIKP